MENPNTIVITGVIFCIAALVHGICGFGFSLLSVSILSLLIGPKIAVPLDLVVASVNCFYLAWLMRKFILYRETVLLVVLTFLFVPLGTLYLRDMNSSLIIRSMGIVILVVSAISLFKAEHLRIFSSRFFTYFAGMAGGLLGGAFNIPGPPLVIYAYNCHWPLINAKANLQFIFSVMALITFISFISADMLNWKIFKLGALYSPFVFAFTFCGAWIAKKIKSKQLAFVVNILLAFLGLTLIFKG